MPFDEEQVNRLYAALERHSNRNACNVIKLLLWTGARCSEVTGARWKEFDLTRALWTKPPARMKTKQVHRVPLNADALKLLRELRSQRPSAEFVFPKQKLNLRRFWIRLRQQANLTIGEESDQPLRIHDLRHWFASAALESGVPKDAISSLLGHSSTVMTDRYAHYSEPFLLEQSNKAMSRLAPTPQPAKVLPFRTRRSA